MRYLLSLLILLLPAAPLTAQTTAPADPLVISVMTMAPGSAVYERFGHNAILVENRAARTAAVYNYGVFSFEQENFIGRFIQGHLLYWMEPHPVRGTIEAYARDDRSIWIQELNLSAEQKLALAEFLEWNAREENKYYRYDYYRDNCSTRVRDALDLVLRGQIKAQTEAIPTGQSFRSHTNRIMAGNVPLYTALVYILGQPIEREISAWEEMFLPLRLMEHLRTVRVTDSAGNSIPLVSQEREIYTSTRPPLPSSPPNWTIAYALTGIVFGALLYFSTRIRWVFGTLAAIWTLLVGFGGCFLAWGWTSTDHWAVRANENILQFFPIAILLPVLIPAGLWKRPHALVWSKGIAFVLVGASAVGMVAKVLPAMYQSNAPIIALSLPVHLGLALALVRLTGKRPELAAGESPKPTKTVAPGR
jgi:hypothetical protein